MLIDARCGLAFPACARAVDEAIRRAREFGVSFAGVTNSHHFGVAAWHLAPVANARHGRTRVRQLAGRHAGRGRQARAVRHESDRGRLSAHATPPLDDRPFAVRSRARQGHGRGEGGTPDSARLGARCARPADDRREGRAAGSMLAMGGTKGAMLALVVELLVTALTGAAMGFEASSFFVDEGNRPRIGQAFLVIDPDALAGKRVYFERVETLVTAMLDDEGVRLPGERRAALAACAAQAGVEIAPRSRNSCRSSPRRDGRRRARAHQPRAAHAARRPPRAAARADEQGCWNRLQRAGRRRPLSDRLDRLRRARRRAKSIRPVACGVAKASSFQRHAFRGMRARRACRPKRSAPARRRSAADAAAIRC